MRKVHVILAILGALTMLLSACGPAPTQVPPTATQEATPTEIVATGTEAPAATEAPTEAMPPVTGAATLAVGHTEALGDFLVDDQGMTLYLYTQDSPDTTVCYDKCATAWPPLLTTGPAVAGDGVDAARIGTTMRTDGTTQVTYAGWPLYYYIKDANPGDVAGQDVGGVWYVISPGGEQIMTMP